MKKCIILTTFIFSLGSCSTIQNLLVEPTSWETVSALKQILNSSAFRAIDKIAKVNKDGIQALLPDEIKPVLTTLKTLGLGAEIAKAEKAIALASEVTLNESKGIVEDAVNELRFEDAVAIVTGSPDAATIALKNAFQASVKKRYSDRLNLELDKADVNKYWPMAQSAYNIFAKNKIEGPLSDLIAERAVDAVFIAIGKEEAIIRNDYKSLESTVVNKVFDYYHNKPSL